MQRNLKDSREVDCIMEKTNNILDVDGESYYYPLLFSKKESDAIFSLLISEIAWKQEPIFIFGKSVMQPRLTAWYGDEEKEYSYSGITMTPFPWTSTLLEIKERVESVAGVKFNSALLNQYRDGNDSMGWHRDNEKELGRNPVIASVSFGAKRIFHLRHSKNKKMKTSIELEHGSLLLMAGETQHHWHHSISKTKKFAGPRINITFRAIL